MVKINIIDKTGKKTGDLKFDLNVNLREDMFKRAVISERSLFTNNYGASPTAGKKQVISLSRRRKNFRGTYGRGASRTPFKVVWNRGSQFRFVGAFSPNTVGGRKAHPPKSSKITLKNMNNKEWVYAMKTGIMASLDKSIVISNGQQIPENYPFIIDNSFDKITKTKEAMTILKKIGFESEIKRLETKTIRAGIGKLRNRKYKMKRGPILVYETENAFVKSIKNIQGFETMDVDDLLVTDLGMSEKYGRSVIFTEDAAKKLMEDIK